MSVLSNTTMRYGPFLFARAIHALIAPILVLLLWLPMMGGSEWPVLFQTGAKPELFSYTPDWGQILFSGIGVFGGVLLLLLMLSLMSSFFLPRRMKK